MTEITFEDVDLAYKKRFTRYEDTAIGNERVIRAHEWARGYAWSRAGVEIDTLLVSAHDRKGSLTVTWSEMPTHALMRAYDLAWEISAAEDAAVEHELLKHRVRIARNT